MINPAQPPSRNFNRVEVGRLDRFFLVLTTLLILLTESIAIILFFKRQKLHLDNVIVYAMPLLVLLPCLEGIRTYRQTTSNSTANTEIKTVVPTIRQSLLTTVGVAYVALVFALLLLITCLRASGDVF